MRDDLKAFFLEPKTAKQRQYEALRAYVLEGMTARQAGLRFGFTETSIYALAHDLSDDKEINSHFSNHGIKFAQLCVPKNR